MKNILNSDKILQGFWKENDRFADLFNTAVFEGNDVLQTEDLTDADVSTLTPVFEQAEKELYRYDLKNRDLISSWLKDEKNQLDHTLVLKKDKKGIAYLLFVISNQDTGTETSLLKILMHNTFHYLNACAQNKAESGLPFSLIALVLYSGERIPEEKPARNSLSFEKTVPADSEFPYVQLHFVDIRKKGSGNSKHEEVSMALDLASAMLNKNFEHVEEVYTTRKISPVIALIIEAMISPAETDI